MKYSDIELVDPVTDDMYQVQVKSSASARDFEKYKVAFGGGEFRKLFFVVHSPDKKLADIRSNKDDRVQVILPKRLSQMIVEQGLINWLLNKIR